MQRIVNTQGSLLPLLRQVNPDFAPVWDAFDQ